DGATGCPFELHRPAHVVDMGMGHDDLLEFELMLLKELENALDLIARIDDERLLCALVPDDGTIAAEYSDGKDLVNQCSDPVLELRRLSRNRLRFRIRSLGRSARLRWRGCLLRWLHTLKNRVAVPAAHHDGERNGSHHEDHRRPGSFFG